MAPVKEMENVVVMPDTLVLCVAVVMQIIMLLKMIQR